MAIEVTCKVCGQPFEPSRKDVLAGPHRWQVCPECREPKDDTIDEPPAAA